VSDAKLIFGTMPIGNLDDSTYRLIDYIKNVDLIAAENEEVVRDIINHYNLSVNGKIISISPKQFMQNGITNNRTGLSESREQIHNKILEHVFLNKTVLCLSDEGSAIVVDPFDAIRQFAISRNIKYKILPGPSAIIDSISYSKLYNGISFSFYGMLFYNKNKTSIYETIKNSDHPSVLFYHHEIQDIFFKELKHFIGSDREVTLLSNLTTGKELIVDGTIDDIIGFLGKNDVRQPTLVVSGKVDK
jgi:16S rRNA (cytidine1402-2'-O)-methyltransferase